MKSFQFVIQIAPNNNGIGATISRNRQSREDKDLTIFQLEQLTL